MLHRLTHLWRRPCVRCVAEARLLHVIAFQDYEVIYVGDTHEAS